MTNWEKLIAGTLVGTHLKGCTYREWECSQPECYETHTSPCTCTDELLDRLRESGICELLEIGEEAVNLRPNVALRLRWEAKVRAHTQCFKLEVL